MSNHQLLVGASVPSGLQALKDFQALKLGEIALLTLPDDKDEAAAVMRYCKEHRIHVMLSEIVHRGGVERWHCPSLDKDTLNGIFKEAGEYYLGRYTIGEAGGILYWPREYTIGRAVLNYDNLPPAADVVDAKEKYIAYMKKYVAREVRDIADGPLLNVDSSMLFKYQVEAGIDHLCLELLPGSPLRMLPAIRGCARCQGRFWGVHIAFGWYGGFQFDEIWLKRWRQTLYLSYLNGAEFIFPESGYYDVHSGPEQHEFDAPKMRAARRVLREFYRFHKASPRPGNSPKTPLAIIFGQYDGCPGLWNKYAWGQYQNGTEWTQSDAERSWDLTAVLTTRETPYSEVYVGQTSCSGNPPCGQYDILPAEASIETLKSYSHLVFLGYNLMDQNLYDKLTEYVRAGGNLLMWLPHLNTNPRRGGDIQLFNGGDLSQLFGVKITGRRPADVTGVKTMPGGSLPLPRRFFDRDPVFMGVYNGANLEITAPDTVVSATFTGIHNYPMADAVRTPALIEHAIGKGHARLVPAFDYPGAPDAREWAEHLLRIVSQDAQGPVRLLASDAVRYAVYEKDGLTVVYALNTEFDVSQNVRIATPDGISGEFAIAPSDMGVFFMRDRFILHPALKETAVEAVAGNSWTLAAIRPQTLQIHNLCAHAREIRINGLCTAIPPQAGSELQCPARQGAIPDEFMADDYLEEPEITIADCRLPY